MTTTSRFRSRPGALVDRWNTFFFTAEPIHPLGLVRIGFGLAVVAWSLVLLPDLFAVFGANGVTPEHPEINFQWSVFQIWPGDTALLVGWVLLIVSAIAMTVGWHSRVAAVLVFVLLQSFVRRGDYYFNAGDSIFTVIALILALSSCGAALSLDQRRRTGSFWSAQTRAVWPIRLLQIQLSIIYLATVQAKLANKTWVDGSAVFYAWGTDGRWALLPAPEWLAANAILINALTWGTLLVELALAILVWSRRWRFWVLAAGVVMHLMIMVNLNVAFFSVAMFVLYLAFVPWATVQRLPTQFRTRRGASSSRRESSEQPAVS
ncbi:HTTM domain-containing protein [Mycolicibacterium celeriflavum]|uniref:HTTM domain-containing protein n=1 Tax=Mycolicibacterium celeriflavum TaxID=1249101 RepID=UPI003CF0C456